jgi:hypothetical protein
MLLKPIRVESAPPAPEVWLLDAHLAGADEQVLRRSARTLTEEAGAPYVSRSYRYPYALAAWHSTPVGIDIERVQTLDRRFAASICTPTERLDCAAPHNPHADFCSLWSSKAALAKALGKPIRYDPRWLGAPMFWPEGRAGCWQSTTLVVANGHVAWLCWPLA